MRTWVVRFVALYVFDVVVLLAIGALVPGVRVGWSALWAGAVLAAATIWLKPVIHRWFQSMAGRSAVKRSRLAEKLVQYLLVLAVAAVIWVLLVAFTGVNVRGFVFGWFVPPIFLLIAWALYDLIDDRLEARAGALYDRATGGGRQPAVPPAAASPAPGAAPARENVDDGLTPEQRRMFDDLGNP
ncbi:hypothetical protein [Microbacterium jiangjiandongii]|uniref:hypothetical protein n=1 Tax=Microbacterium jiangjiandongii TaxID=3049071 RepID=UPI00214D09B1|nr:hypothetical protein [Microbacterium sp. zg.Y843]MCR2815734.1 hypothetical protein [Microbacterium sp. zg.Y843]